ncbi:hypothetical protein KY290_027986 [Solanum tuberosum]|uniref:Uncharacterized protein n=1 Tax=Solanum tuberosum TaxID=4113 RepID=A0ABQ7UGK9_SOLTU|nr:hypothetical protein KY290_027986 [Solanum tuberosum]
MKCLPAITIWELWKTRCDAKYGKEFYNTRKTVNNISSTLAGLLKNQFKLINVDPNWDSIVCLMKSKINAINIIQVKWLKPSISFVKINSDGSCKDGYCRGGRERFQVAGGLCEQLECHPLENTGRRRRIGVADALASTRFSSPGNILYEYFEELPAKVKGLTTMDRWGVTSFRTRQKKKQDLIWDPP